MALACFRKLASSWPLLAAWLRLHHKNQMCCRHKNSEVSLGPRLSPRVKGRVQRLSAFRDLSCKLTALAQARQSLLRPGMCDEWQVMYRCLQHQPISIMLAPLAGHEASPLSPTRQTKMVNCLHRFGSATPSVPVLRSHRLRVGYVMAPVASMTRMARADCAVQNFRAPCRLQHTLRMSLSGDYLAALYKAVACAAEQRGEELSDEVMAALAQTLASSAVSSRSEARDGAAAERLGRFAPMLGSDDVALFYHSSHSKMQAWQRELVREQDCEAASCASQPPGVGLAAYDGDTETSSAPQPRELHTRHADAVPSRDGASREGSAAMDNDGGNGYVVLRSARNMLEGSTGCHLWPAALWLAQHILQHPDVVRGKRCFELGCGVGLLGIILARCGARQVRTLPGGRGPLMSFSVPASVCGHAAAYAAR